LLGEFLKLPFAVFVSTMEILVEGMRSFQNLMNQGIAIVTNGTLDDSHQRMEGGVRLPTDVPLDKAPVRATGPGDIPDPMQKEQPTMSDCYEMGDDLGSDDLKVVRWRIIFKKREYEVTLDRGSDLIDYSTTSRSLSGIKISDFVSAARDGKRPRAYERLRQKKYQPRGKKTSWYIPADDMRYVTFLYSVVDRISKEADDYERRKVHALEGLEKTVKKIEKKI
jgi:hypothetical protein